MPNETPRKVTLNDPLSTVTRRERKFLLVSSITGITIVKTGFIPSKISALGIEFAQTDQNSLLFVIGLVILYFLIAFLIYGTSDFLIWRLNYSSVLQDAMINQWKSDVEKTPVMEMSGYIAKHLDSGFLARVSFYVTQIVSWLRAVFEFLLPIFLGIYAIIIIWSGRI